MSKPLLQLRRTQDWRDSNSNSNSNRSAWKYKTQTGAPPAQEDIESLFRSPDITIANITGPNFILMMINDMVI